MEEYTGKEWTALLKEMNPRQLRNSIKAGYRRTAKKVQEIAARKVEQSGLRVQGGKNDLKKGMRSYIYSRGGGFKVTVKPRGKKGYHTNRYGKQKPVLMWAAEGTNPRNTRGMVNNRRTGRMPSYGFMDKALPEAGAVVERELYADLDAAVTKAARKAGFI